MIKAHAYRNPSTLQVDVYLYEDLPSGRHVLTLDGDSVRRHKVTPGAEMKPFASLHVDVADAVRGALADLDGAPSRGERVAALEAENATLREWLRDRGADA